MTAPLAPKAPEKSLAITALYTAEVWRREGLPGAELLATPDAARVFGVTNGALSLARVFGALSRLIGRVRWSPLPIALAHRHALLDRWTAESDAAAVVELASGLSPRGLSESGRSPRPYIEVDVPEMVAWKTHLLGRSEAGRAALARPNWRLIGSDLRELALDTIVTSTAPTFVIAEGLMMYLDADAQRQLFKRLSAVLAAGSELAFDLVPPAEEPPPGLFGRALGFLMRRFTKGAGFVASKRTRAEVLDDLRAAGFLTATACDAWQVVGTLGLPHAGVWTRQVLFRASV